MNLYLWRKWLSEECTIGELFIDGTFECFILEDPVRPYPEKIPGNTAIWEGTYQVLLTYSPKYKRVMPLIADVPMFEGIRMHSGNKNVDTAGCLLLGRSHSADAVFESRAAFNSFFPKLQRAIAKGEACSITISTAPPVNNVT